MWKSQNPRGRPRQHRLREVIRGSAAEPAEAIAVAITADLRRFRGEARQEDDSTVVLVKIADVEGG
ncbi:MAG TPA: hypothetical protein VIL46_10210 [Gemmataceae bacterium]